MGEGEVQFHLWKNILQLAKRWRQFNNGGSYSGERNRNRFGTDN